MRWLLVLFAFTSLACGPAISERHDVSYDDAHGAATTLDVLTPLNEDVHRPALVLIHGGGWDSESKDRLSDFARRWAESGYVAINLNYRLVPDGAYPHAVQDVHCALSWVRAHADELGIDPDRIAVFGYSAGGHLASLLGVAIDDPAFAPDCGLPPTSPPRAVISGAGVQDLKQLAWAWQVQNFVGGTLEELPELYARASPIERVERGAPPFLFIHGEQDAFVPVDQSDRMAARLREVGTAADVLRLRGGGHILNPNGSAGTLGYSDFSAESPEAFTAMSAFLERELGR